MQNAIIIAKQYLILLNFNFYNYSLLNNSFEEQLAFQNALRQFVTNVDTDYAKGNVDFFIAFEGSFGNKHVTPRTLTSRFLGNLVCIEGIVTKCKYIYIYIYIYILLYIVKVKYHCLHF